jgi:hypothetical protein
MSNKVFEEAIADAKKLREVAEANAKKAVLEAVTPKIREFIESELLENSNNNEEEQIVESDESEDVTLDESALLKLSSLLGIDIDKEAASSRDVVSEATKDAFQSLTLEQQDELRSIADKINERRRTLSDESISNKESNLKENSKMSEKFYEVDLDALREAIETELAETMAGDDSRKVMDEKEDDGAHEGEDHRKDAMEEASLEEMLQELKLVLDLGDDIEEDQIPEELRGMVEEDDDDDEEGDVEVGEEDADAGADDEPDEADEAEDDFQDMMSEDDLMEVDETMLAEEILRIRKMIAEGNMDHHFGGKGEGKAGVDGAYGGKGSGKVGAKKSFGGGSEGQDVFTNPPTMNKLAEAFRSERRKNRALGEKLKKYRSAVDTLREQLEDLNLFNAKLLYVNKLLQNKNLNESEKKSVIKALDEANSLREAKSLYKSLTETFTRGSGKTLTESRTRGSSSKPTTSSAPKGGAPELDRWQRLAGLK